MSKSRVLIVDYGLGNLFNVHRALAAAGGDPFISGSKADILKADRLLIPGVGAFNEGMRGLEERGLVEPIREFAKAGKPIMGICLGAQLMLSQSEEHGLHAGLDLVKGTVVHMRRAVPGGEQYKLPHIGWNELKVPDFANNSLWDKTVLRGLAAQPSMYFLHSYIMTLQDPRSAIALTEHGHDRFCSVFQSNHLVGIQPHPERSGEIGLKVYRNFLEQ